MKKVRFLLILNIAVLIIMALESNSFGSTLECGWERKEVECTKDGAPGKKIECPSGNSSSCTLQTCTPNSGTPFNPPPKLD
jgi:hypothetical protein